MRAEHSPSKVPPVPDTGEEDRILIREFLSERGTPGEAGGAFDRLVMKYRDRIFSLCYRMLGDYEEANDCSQEVFIKVYRGLEGFKFQSHFSTWLYRIAVNTCKNQLGSRAHRDREKTLGFGHTAGNTEYSFEPGSVAESPDRLFERSETERTVQRAIQTLPDQQRLLVLLRDVEGRPYEEIASLTGIALGTVKSRLNRAREQLKSVLKAELSDEL